jgi:hypothetical protein
MSTMLSSLSVARLAASKVPTSQPRKRSKLNCGTNLVQTGAMRSRQTRSRSSCTRTRRRPRWTRTRRRSRSRRAASARRARCTTPPRTRTVSATPRRSRSARRSFRRRCDTGRTRDCAASAPRRWQGASGQDPDGGDWGALNAKDGAAPLPFACTGGRIGVQSWGTGASEVQDSMQSLHSFIQHALHGDCK